MLLYIRSLDPRVLAYPVHRGIDNAACVHAYMRCQHIVAYMHRCIHYVLLHARIPACIHALPRTCIVIYTLQHDMILYSTTQ